MSDVPKAQADWAEAQIEQLSQQTFQDLALIIQGDGDRLKAFTQDGALFGLISRDSEQIVPEGAIRLAYTISKDGKLRAVWQSGEG